MSIKKRHSAPRYDDAFKAGAIKTVPEQARPLKVVAADYRFLDTIKVLKICFQHLYNVRYNSFSWLFNSGKSFLIISHISTKFTPS